MPGTPKKVRQQSTSAPARKVPVHADYCDDVTDEHMRRINDAVSDEDLSNAEVVSGPGW